MYRDVNGTIVLVKGCEQIRQNAKRELGDIKGKYKPLLNLPPLTREKKEDILIIH